MPVLTEAQLLEAKPFKYQVLAKLRDGREPFTSSGYGPRPLADRPDAFHWGDDDVYPRVDEPANGWESDGRVAVPQGTPVFAPCDGYLQDIDHLWQNKSGGHVWLNVFTAPCPDELLAKRAKFNGWDPVLNPWAAEHSTGWKLGVWHFRMVFVRDFQVVRAGQLLGIAGFDPRNNPSGPDLNHTHKEVQKLGAGQQGSVDPKPHFADAAVLPWTPIWPGMIHTPNGPINPPWSPGELELLRSLSGHVRRIESACTDIRSELDR